jgi:hypothetical protein
MGSPEIPRWWDTLKILHTFGGGVEVANESRHLLGPLWRCTNPVLTGENCGHGFHGKFFWRAKLIELSAVGN